jgi:hypothetical protein
MADLAQALMNLRSGAKWVLAGSSMEGLSWLDPDQSRPSQQEIDEELLRLDQEYQQTQYQRMRAAAYPTIQDQLDMLYHLGYDGWKTEIEKIKLKYPKPNTVGET